MEGIKIFIEFISILRSLRTFIQLINPVSLFASTSQSFTLTSITALNSEHIFYGGCLVNINYIGDISSSAFSVNISAQGHVTNVVLNNSVAASGIIQFMIPNIDVTSPVTAIISISTGNEVSNNLQFLLSPPPLDRLILSPGTPSAINYVPNGSSTLQVRVDNLNGKQLHVSGALTSESTSISITSATYTSSSTILLTFSYVNVKNINTTSSSITANFILELFLDYILVPAQSLSDATVPVTFPPQ